MQSFLRSRTVLLAALCSLGLAVMAPAASAAAAPAKPKPGAPGKRGFRLFARTLGAMTINRIYCGLNSDGEVCVDSTNSSTIGGGFWPKGTPDQYVFNSGLQIAGVIGDNGGPWAGDTTGAFFFDPKGTTQHGEEVEPIYNTTDPDDAAFIGDTLASDPVALAARVPNGDPQGDLFFPLLRGRTAASGPSSSPTATWASRAAATCPPRAAPARRLRLREHHGVAAGIGVEALPFGTGGNLRRRDMAIDVRNVRRHNRRGRKLRRKRHRQDQRGDRTEEQVLHGVDCSPLRSRPSQGPTDDEPARARRRSIARWVRHSSGPTLTDLQFHARVTPDLFIKAQHLHMGRRSVALLVCPIGMG